MSACSAAQPSQSPQSPQGTPADRDDGTVVYAAYSDMEDWDPSAAFSLEVVVLANVYEPLVWYNAPGSNQPFRPGLATSWSASADGLSWTFKLRDGVKFHDGEPFTAEAVKYSVDRTKKLKKGGSYIWDPVKEVVAVDPLTVKFILSEPAPIDLIASAQYAAYIMSPKSAERGADWFGQGNDAGTGPYKVTRWDKGQEILLDRFDGYWGGWRGAHFSKVIVKVVTEAATQVQMIGAGQADFASLVPVDSLPRLRTNPDVEVLLAASWKNSMFLINTRKAPTDNPKVRQALAYAWDYEAVAKNVYNGTAAVANGPVPRSMWGSLEKPQMYKFDIERARQLIREAGFKEGELKLTLQYISTSEEYKNAALLLQSNLAKIGVNLELLPGPWTAIWTKAKNLDTAPNLQSMTWWPTYPTPNDWLIGMFKTEKKPLFNLSYYSNAEVDRLLDEAVKLEATDRTRAVELYRQVQEILMKDAVGIFYADLESRLVKRRNVAGYKPNPAYEAVLFRSVSRTK